MNRPLLSCGTSLGSCMDKLVASVWPATTGAPRGVLWNGAWRLLLPMPTVAPRTWRTRTLLVECRVVSE
jgi:hypothetical protein